MAAKEIPIQPAEGKLGILLVGLGAVSTTFVAGVEAIRKELRQPIGSLTQLGHIRLGKRTDQRNPKISDLVPLADLHDLEFAAWDVFEDNAYEAARKAGVLPVELLDKVREPLEELRPLPAVFNQSYVRKLNGPNVKKQSNKKALAEAVMEDIEKFKERKGVDRLVMVWCGSTEVFMKANGVHKDVRSFEKGLESSDDSIAPSMIYAYAACKMGIPFANGAPNLTSDIPVINELALEYGAPLSGKRF